MNGSMQFIIYATMSVSAMIVVLALVHYYRLRLNQYLALAAGGVAYLAGWAIPLSGSALSLPRPQSVVEIAAIAMWSFSYCWKDRAMKTRLIIVSAAMIVVAALLQAVSPTVDGIDPTGAISEILKIGLVALSLVYAVTSKAPGRHYFVQSCVFFLLSFMMRIFSQSGPDGESGRQALMIFHSVAAGFGCVSILLFLDTLTATRGGQRKRQEMMARVYEMIPEITRQLQSLHDVGATDRFFTSGIKLVALTIEKNFGCTKIFIGQQEKGERGIKLESCVADPELAPVLSTIKLPEVIVSELVQTRHPILISDTAADPRTLMDKSYELLDIASFAAVPFIIGDNPCIVMLVGEKTDGMPVDENDAALLDIISARMTEVFEAFLQGPDSDVPGDLDSVTMLRNFSSFQRLLTEKVAEADVSSGSFALLLFDTDKFSIINEELGYESGDQILRQVGEELAKYVDPGMAGRVGADEFAVVMPNEGENIREKVSQILGDLNQNLKSVGDGRLSISAAYSIYPYDFLEQTGVFGKMHEMLAVAGSTPGKIVRVKVG